MRISTPTIFNWGPLWQIGASIYYVYGSVYNDRTTRGGQVRLRLSEEIQPPDSTQ